jgi:hypothetical protein
MTIRFLHTADIHLGNTPWVKPPDAIVGLDHLAVTSLYDKMLPGITNATDRARDYSFYPILKNPS